MRYIFSFLILLAGLNAVEIYEAKLSSLNASKIGGEAKGEATLEVDGDKLTISIKMEGVPPNIEHWEHFHGFPDGREAECVGAHDHGADGYVDLIETEHASGITMVPFNDDPAKMEIPTNTYPRADANGRFMYKKVVELKELDKNFGEVYKGQKIALDKRVIYVHGVPEAHNLPKSVASLGPVPSHVTLPIACGKIVRIK